MARKVGIDFTGVESFKKASEGEHVCKIVSADMKQSQGGNDMIVVAYEVTKGEDRTARVYENYPLVETALWKLKGLLEALGMKADGKVSIDLDRLIGKIVTVVVRHEEYDGKVRARVDEVKKFSAATKSTDVDDEDDFEDKEETPAPKKTSKKSSKKAPMNPPEDEDDEEDWDEEDDDEEEEAPAPKKSSKKAEKPKATQKKASKKSAKAEEEDDDDDDWDDDDWDE